MLLLIFIVLALTNFGFSAVVTHDWSAALDHTWWEGTAILTVYVAQLIRSKTKLPKTRSTIEITKDFLTGTRTEE